MSAFKTEVECKPDGAYCSRDCRWLGVADQFPWCDLFSDTIFDLYRCEGCIEAEVASKEEMPWVLSGEEAADFLNRIFEVRPPRRLLKETKFSIAELAEMAQKYAEGVDPVTRTRCLTHKETR